MASDTLSLVQQVLDTADALRDRVNEPRRHALLRRQEVVVWNTLCSAMDVVSDTCQAMRSYCDIAARPSNGDARDIGAAHLLAYGLLHALYLQQDAVFWWGKMLRLADFQPFKKPGGWARSIPELAIARQARNDTTGHPVRRDEPKSLPVTSSFIVQHSVSDGGFTFIEHDEHGNTSFPFKRVSFSELIEGQMRALARILEAAGRELDAADRKHCERFMNRPLTPILSRLDYVIGKLGARKAPDRQLIAGAVEDVEGGLERLKAEIIEREEPFDAQWQWEYRKLSRALSELTAYAAGSDVDDDLADVFADYVRYSVDHLMVLTAELDARYTQNT